MGMLYIKLQCPQSSLRVQYTIVASISLPQFKPDLDQNWHTYKAHAAEGLGKKLDGSSPLKVLTLHLKWLLSPIALASQIQRKNQK